MEKKVIVIEEEKPGTTTVEEIFGQAIHSYTRAEAIEDGFLADVSPLAKEAGFKFPVALTSAAYEVIRVPGNMKKYGQDFTGRLWDVFTMLKAYIRKSEGDTVLFPVLFQNIPHHMTEITFKSVVSGGDHGEPVITIMLPNED